MNYTKAKKIDFEDYAIIAENICKSFSRKPLHSFFKNLFGVNYKNKKDFQALEDISFKIRKGESVGILGDNGSGKSTLLQIIAKTMQPSFGKLLINGKVAALLELGSGFNPDFSGRENVYLNGSIIGMSKSRIDQIINEVIEFADIDHFFDRPVKMYSSGMRMRLAFAVQVFVEPEILVIDEALGVGDQNFRLKCFNKVDELLSKGITFILVTHNQEMLNNLTDRTIVLDEGKIAIDSDTFNSIDFYNKRISSKSEFRASLHDSNSCSFCFLDNNSKLKEKFHEGEDIIVNFNLSKINHLNLKYIKFIVRNKQRILIYEKTVFLKPENLQKNDLKFRLSGIIARNIYSLESVTISEELENESQINYSAKEIKYFEVLNHNKNSITRGICDMGISILN